MNESIERLYRRIGEEAMNLAEDRAGRLLVYAEVEGGLICADMFYVQDKVGNVRFRFCTPTLQSLIQELWTSWKATAGNREWRVLGYVIDGDEFAIDLTYPEQIDENDDISERRPVAVKKYFGDAMVDYSKP